MFVNTLAATSASSLCLAVFGDKGVAISIVIMTFLLLTFGEITPKVIAIRSSEAVALFVAPFMKLIFMAAAPIRKVLRAVVDAIVSVAVKGIKEQKEGFTEEELKIALELGRREGQLDAREEEMLKGIFRFHDKTARDVMMPLSRIVAADISTPLGTVRSIVREKELSRLPIFEERLDNIAGILYAKDIIVAGLKGDVVLRDILRKPFYISEKIKLKDLLREFRVHQVHMAIVRNREEKVMGIVTLNDLLEEIVGQICDVKTSGARCT
jgi:putative hemolysin